MKRTALFCALLLLQGVALGQTAAPLASASGFAGWDCLPSSLGGSGGQLGRVQTAKGKAWWWMCPSVVGLPKTNALTVLDSWKPDPLRCPNVYTATFDAIYSQPLNTLQALNIVLSQCGSTPAAGSPEESDFKELIAAAGAEWYKMHPEFSQVPTGAYIVAPNVLSKTVPQTRPVFGFVGGLRKAQVANRLAEVGQPCKPEVAQVKELANIYMAFGPAFSPKEVTLCKSAP